jgi:hypothetical protein
MENFTGKGFGRTIIIQLDRGEKIVESVSERLKAEGIKNAVVIGAVGSLQKLIYHRPTGMGAATVDEFLTIEEPMEICSITGTVIDGTPHFHVVASGLECLYGGHLETETEVLYLAEITLAELQGYNLERRTTKENVKKVFEKDSDK